MHCEVCGAFAKGSNYGVKSCMSCKVFFQRHGLKNNNTNKLVRCRFSNGLCEINEKTRKHCISCRLAACLQAGMCRKHTISSEYAKKRQQLADKRQMLIEKKYRCAQLVSLDLLHADRSSLNEDQWCLISNITHTYDTLFQDHKQKLVHLHLPDEQKPLKLRLKIANYQQLVATYFTFIVPFLEHIPDYQSLELSNRLTLIHHNMVTLTGINSHYLASTIGFIPYFDKNYAAIMTMIYGNEMILANEKLRQQLDNTFHADLILVKLALVIFAFDNVTPSLSSTGELSTKSMNEERKSSNKLFRIQNNYVDVLWRYMLFRFRHEQVVAAEQNDTHKAMYDSLIEQMESKLNFQDEL